MTVSVGLDLLPPGALGLFEFVFELFGLVHVALFECALVGTQTRVGRRHKVLAVVTELVERHGKVGEAIVVFCVGRHFGRLPQHLVVVLVLLTRQVFGPFALEPRNVRVVGIVHLALYAVAAACSTPHGALLELHHGTLTRGLVGDGKLADVLEILVARKQVAHERARLGNAKHIAIAKLEADGALGDELERLAPELVLDRTPALRLPALALGVEGDDGRLMHHLLGQKAQMLVVAHTLKRLAQQRVERLAARAQLGAGIARHGKRAHEAHALLPVVALARALQQVGRILVLLRRRLQQRERTVERDGEADRRQILADVLLEHAEQRHLVARHLGRQLLAVLYHRLAAAAAAAALAVAVRDGARVVGVGLRVVGLAVGAVGLAALGAREVGVVVGLGVVVHEELLSVAVGVVEDGRVGAGGGERGDGHAAAATAALAHAAAEARHGAHGASVGVDARDVGLDRGAQLVELGDELLGGHVEGGEVVGVVGLGAERAHDGVGGGAGGGLVLECARAALEVLDERRGLVEVGEYVGEVDGLEVVAVGDVETLEAARGALGDEGAEVGAPGFKVLGRERLEVEDAGARVDVDGAVTLGAGDGGVGDLDGVARGLVRADGVGEDALVGEHEEALGIALHLLALLLEDPSGVHHVQLVDLAVVDGEAALRARRLAVAVAAHDGECWRPARSLYRGGWVLQVSLDTGQRWTRTQPRQVRWRRSRCSKAGRRRCGWVFESGSGMKGKVQVKFGRAREDEVEHRPGSRGASKCSETGGERASERGRKITGNAARAYSRGPSHFTL